MHTNINNKQYLKLYLQYQHITAATDLQTPNVFKI